MKKKLITVFRNVAHKILLRFCIPGDAIDSTVVCCYFFFFYYPVNVSTKTILFPYKLDVYWNARGCVFFRCYFTTVRQIKYARHDINVDLTRIPSVGNYFVAIVAGRWNIFKNSIEVNLQFNTGICFASWVGHRCWWAFLML